ncbi:MAG: quinone-dependent dihydroorotate dehydrogenase, partial [Alphaproteobacteria bacterium]
AEVGTVTPRPQPGNPRPRLFRLTQDRAVINRFGFNNAGLEALARRLERRHGQPGVVGANIGANKDSPDPVADYVTGIRRLYGLADYFTINVSSPNTPGLRALQARDSLHRLLDSILTARTAAHGERSGRPTPVLLKIAPDLTDNDQVAIAEVVLEQGVDGLIISNTTVERPAHLKSPHGKETGGLSGAPLFERSTSLLRRFYQLTGGRVPLIGVGGVSSGADAYAKIRAGASLVQLYSAMVYEGPGLVRRICRDLGALLEADGYGQVAEAVGADV